MADGSLMVGDVVLRRRPLHALISKVSLFDNYYVSAGAMEEEEEDAKKNGVRCA